MREMKDSGIEWIGIIPKSWNISRLKYIAKFFNGDRGKNYPSGEDLVDDGIAFLTSNNIHGIVLDCSQEKSKFITEERYNRLGGAKIQLNDIAFCLRGSVGNCAINKTLTKGTVASSLMIIRPIKASSDFINYVLQTDVCDVQTIKAMNGSCAANLSAENVSNYYFVEPPIAEQKKIVIFLDSKCSEIDAISADIQKEIETLEQYKRSVITEAVTKGLNPDVEMKDSGAEWIGKIPLNWKLEKGKHLFRQRNSKGNNISLQLLSPSQKYGVIPQTLLEKLTTQNVVKTNERADLGNFKTIHKGDFCISLRSFQGGFEYSEYEGVVSPAYQVFYKVEPLYNNYYRYLFKENSFIKKMNSFTMTMRDGKNIAFSDFGGTYIPVPPLDEQEKIATFLNKKSSEIDSLVAEKKQQLEVLDSYKKSLIYEYVTGKKEVV